ncbi:MAG: hypothetical protein ABWK05_04105 [Pyrobaculum sp.]
MEILVAATSIGKRRFFIDVTHWPSVERYHKPFLVNAGWPRGLATSVLNIGQYIEEVAQIYAEASEAAATASKDFIKAAAKTWPWRFLIPTKIEVDAEAWKEARTCWEIKTHIESVVGRRFDQWGEVYAGRAPVELRGEAVYIGGVPSVGHTYLRLIGVLNV